MCPLCDTPAYYYDSIQGSHYYYCPCCSGISLDVDQRLTTADEFQRYQEHNNNPFDPRYRSFVQPVVSKMLEVEHAGSIGLDYGAGPGSAVVAMLQEQGFSMEVFDPFYFPNLTVLQPLGCYDFIVCTEAMEHFFEPNKEFSLLVDLLRPGGSLYCMTLLYEPDVDFAKWHYRMDPTHVFFYQMKTLEWMSLEFGLELRYINKTRAFSFLKPT
jgi:SAM-dependent methyltransferase